MRSIIVYSIGLAIAGLIHAQDRPRLVSTTDMSLYHDLASTRIGTENATAFIDYVCSHRNPSVSVKVAFNVETSAFMDYSEYRIRGPGALGNERYGYAIYPWSTVEGICNPILNSSWVMNRAVAMGAGGEKYQMVHAEYAGSRY
jgi:hypothetical protein